MKGFTINGWNEFYSGWLCAILLQPIPEDSHEFFVDGYRMAQEAGLRLSITVLQDEIRLKHITVTTNPT